MAFMLYTEFLADISPTGPSRPLEPLDLTIRILFYIIPLLYFVIAGRVGHTKESVDA